MSNLPLHSKPCKRRHWLKMAASSAIAAGAPLRATEGKGKGKSEADANSFCPLGFGTYGLPDYSLRQAIKLVAETGFDSIEFACMPGYPGSPDQIDAAQRKQLLRILEDSELRLGALMGLPFPDEKQADKSSASVAAMLELAADLTAENGKPPVIQSVLGGGDWEQKKNLFRDTLGSWLLSASGSDIEISIKPHRGHAMSRPEQAVWLIEQLDAAGKLSLVYDASHYVHRDLDLDETVQTALPHTGYLVVKDAVQNADGKVRFQLPGQSGEMPHARILKQFHDGGYRGEVCCEVSSQVWKAEGYDPESATRTCYANLVDIFSEAGLTRSRR